MKDNSVDKIAKQALEEYRAPFNPDDWADMESRLDKQRRVAPRLWMVKGFEVLLVLLTLLTIHNVVNTHPVSAEWKVENGVESGEWRVESDAVSIENGELRMENGAVSIENGELKIENAGNEAVVQNKMAGNVGTLVGNDGGRRGGNGVVSNPLLLENLPFANTNVFDNGIIDANGTNGANAANKAANDGTNWEYNPEVQEDAILEETPTFSIFNTLSSLGSKLTAPPAEMPDIKLAAKAAPEIRKPPARKRTKQEIDFAMGFAPEATVRGKSGTFSMGYQIFGGVTAYFMDRFAIETGITYSLKRFYEEKNFTLNPNENPPFNQILEKRQVSINTVEVPLGLRVDAYRNRHIRLYVNCGASIHAALWNVYLKERTASGIQPDGSVLVEYQTAERLSAENGLMQGGGMNNNLYFSANIGMGIEFKANERSSLFLQPTYRHALKGIGPDNERFHSMSLLIGFRAKLR